MARRMSGSSFKSAFVLRHSPCYVCIKEGEDLALDDCCHASVCICKPVVLGEGCREKRVRGIGWGRACADTHVGKACPPDKAGVSPRHLAACQGPVLWRAFEDGDAVWWAEST